MAKLALLIGVSEYEPGLNPLPAAVKDIEAMQRVLLDPEMGGFDRAKSLANPDRQTMEFGIETLFSSCTRDDLVLLFFSGHGIKDDRGRLYFATRITRKNKKGDLVRSSAVSTSFVHDIMNNSRCRRQAIILDCCFSGAFDPALQARNDSSVDLRSQLGAEGRVVLTSSSSTEYSFEQKETDLSIYTRYLVEGIETGAGDANEDGFVSVLELHEYAASKVRKTAPQMTPKIIVLKEKGFEIVLAKARVTDPKLKYRKEALRQADKGTIQPIGRAILDNLRQQLGLTVEEAAEIEAEVLRPYQERLKNLQTYKETLIKQAEYEYPLSESVLEQLNRLQKMFGLRDEDVLPIQQEVKAQFAQQAAAYQQNLVQYEQALTEAIQREFPFSQQTRQELGNLQQSLGLRDEDIARVERPLIQSAELRYQEELRQKVKQQQQERERIRQQQEAERLRQQQEAENKQEVTKSVSESVVTPSLQRFEFDVVTVEAEIQRSGLFGLGSKVTFHSNRSHSQAQYFTEELGDGLGLDMVLIPSGSFMMGTEDEEIERLCKTYDREWFRGERPQHQVNVPNFFMGRYPITQGQWRAVAGWGQVERKLDLDPSNFKDDYEGIDRWTRPVENISWEDAKEFCNRLSKKTKRKYRLPTEAEWEYACRAMNSPFDKGGKGGSPFHFGETISTELANYRGTD